MKDLLSPALRAIEHEVDNAYLANPLVHRKFAPAAWYFLAFCEEIGLHSFTDLETEHEYAALFDNVINHSKWPLRWLAQACGPGGVIPRSFEEDAYEGACHLSELAMDYLAFETAFTYGTLGLLTLTAEGNRVRATDPMRKDSRFEAYDRFMLPSQMPDLNPLSLSFFDELVASVRIRGRRFSYSLNPKLVRDAVDSVGEAVNIQFSLPPHWKFPLFTIEEFRQVARVLWVLALIHFFARTAAARSGCENAAFAGALLLMDRVEIVRRVCRYSGVSEIAVNAIVQNLTYGNGLANPDPALQPLIRLSESKLALCPQIVMHSSMERNPSVLINRLPELRTAYAALSGEKESASRERIANGLSGLGFRFWYGQVKEWGAASDVDFVVISDREQECLILELKSFIAPAEPREIRDRSEEIREGIEQVRRRMTMAESLRAPLLSVLAIDAHYHLGWAVASDSSIGAGYVQDPDVPVINTRHLISKLHRSSGLSSCRSWLENREYLPTRGVDYKERELEVRIGDWILEWYGIEPLVDGL